MRRNYTKEGPILPSAALLSTSSIFGLSPGPFNRPRSSGVRRIVIPVCGLRISWWLVPPRSLLLRLPKRGVTSRAGAPGPKGNPSDAATARWGLPCWLFSNPGGGGCRVDAGGVFVNSIDGRTTAVRGHEVCGQFPCGGCVKCSSPLQAAGGGRDGVCAPQPRLQVSHFPALWVDSCARRERLESKGANKGAQSTSTPRTIHPSSPCTHLPYQFHSPVISLSSFNASAVVSVMSGNAEATGTQPTEPPPPATSAPARIQRGLQTGTCLSFIESQRPIGRDSAVAKASAALPDQNTGTAVCAPVWT